MEYQTQPVVVDAVQLATDVYIHGLDVRMKAGSWLITLSDGTQYPLTDEMFQQLFTAV